MVGRQAFPFGMAYFQGRTVKLREGNIWFACRVNIPYSSHGCYAMGLDPLDPLVFRDLIVLTTSHLLVQLRNLTFWAM